LKRSNRLVLLVGIFLAIVAFVAIALTLNRPATDPGTATPTKTNVVIAAKDLPLGSKITADAVTTKEVNIADKPVNGYGDVAAVIGQTAREAVTNGQFITSQTLSGAAGQISTIEVPAGYVGISLQVDQVSGVGTLIKPGDNVDMLIGLAGDKFPVVTLNPDDNSVTVVSGLNATSVKLLLQGMQVLGTLLPPPPADTGQNQGTTTGGQTSLNGQQEIVILAVKAQQAEVIKYAQMDGNISLVLRAAADFRDPVTGLPLDTATIIPVETTGITLRSLVDDYGILIPELVEGIVPQQSPAP
jgi:pilus assembly protein CpaB